VVAEHKETINKISGAYNVIKGIEYSDMVAVEDKDDLIALLVRLYGETMKARFEIKLSDEDASAIIYRIGNTSEGLGGKDGITSLEKLAEEVFIAMGDWPEEKQTDDNPKSMPVTAYGGDENLWVGWLPKGSVVRIFNGDPQDRFRKWFRDVFNSPTRSHEYPVAELSYVHADTDINISMIGSLVSETTITENRSNFTMNMAEKFDMNFEEERKYFVVQVSSTMDISINSQGVRTTFEKVLTDEDLELFLSGKELKKVDTIWFVVVIGRDGWDLVEWTKGNTDL
jgi:hypothetical protein